LSLVVWFWFTPIVYPGALVQEKLTSSAFLDGRLWEVFLLNPMASIVFAFQRALYGDVAPGGSAVLPTVSVAWLLAVLGLVLAASLVVLAVAWRTFFRLSGDFAEEL
jgi:ABC-2 type transport system permease protein